MMSELERLEEWYAAHCNGEWEEEYGVTIGTLDNPGWKVAIDLVGTPWATLVRPPHLVERSENDWMHSRVEASQFVGNCGPRNLRELIREVFTIVDSEGG